MAYISEKEQIEQLKHLWKNYGLPLVLGVVIAGVGIFIWRFWQHHQQANLEQASQIYQQQLMNIVNGDTQAASDNAKILLNNYQNTPYAGAAMLMQARTAVAQKNYSEALSDLQWTIDHTKQKMLVELARMRAARILLQLQKPQQALNMLEKTADSAFLPAIAEIKGDSYSQLNKLDLAKAEYKKALQGLAQKKIDRPILAMKYAHVGGKVS